jgi:DNA-binding transcriptional MerR regulator
MSSSFPKPQTQATPPQLLTIGAMAKAAGVTVRALRYYEELGLIAPETRSNSQYRLYDAGILRRIKAILALQDLGYSLEQVLVVLGVYRGDGSTDTSRQVQLETSQASLKQIVACIEDRLTQLNTMRTTMRHKLLVLDTVCQPCVQADPHTACDTDCTHREAHMD